MKNSDYFKNRQLFYLKCKRIALNNLKCKKSKIRTAQCRHTYPFEENNIKLSISFDDSSGILGDGHVALMGIAKNHMLFYDAYDPKTEDFYSLHRESYEEAVEIVKNQSDGEKK